MKFTRIGLTGLLVGTLLSQAAVAVTPVEGVADSTAINDPYIRAVPPVVKTSAAFMQIQNSSDTERFIVAADTPIAGAVELHIHIHDDGVMRMRRIPHVHLPPRQTVSLEPGGLHVMLFDLKQPLKPGDEIPLTLQFDDGSRKTVTAIVRTVQSTMKH